MSSNHLNKTPIVDKNGKATHVYKSSAERPVARLTTLPTPTPATEETKPSEQPTIADAWAMDTATASPRVLDALRESDFVPETKYESNIGEGTTEYSLDINDDGAVLTSTTYADMSHHLTAFSASESVKLDDDGRLLIAETVASVNEQFAADNAEYSNSDSGHEESEQDKFIESVSNHTGIAESEIRESVRFENRFVNPSFDADDARELAEELALEVAPASRADVFSPGNEYTPEFTDSGNGLRDQFGYSEDGYAQGGQPTPFDKDRAGYTRNGFHMNRLHRDTGTLYDSEGFDREGFNADGFNAGGESMSDNARDYREKRVPGDRVRLRDGDLKVRVRESRVRGAKMLTDADYAHLTEHLNDGIARNGITEMDAKLHKRLMGEVGHFAQSSYGKQVAK